MLQEPTEGQQELGTTGLWAVPDWAPKMVHGIWCGCKTRGVSWEPGAPQTFVLQQEIFFNDCAIAGWAGGHCCNSVLCPLNKTTCRSELGRQKTSRDPQEASYRPRGQKRWWKASHRYTFPERCPQGDRSCTAEVWDDPYPLRKPSLQRYLRSS